MLFSPFLLGYLRFPPTFPSADAQRQTTLAGGPAPVFDLPAFRTLNGNWATSPLTTLVQSIVKPPAGVSSTDFLQMHKIISSAVYCVAAGACGSESALDGLVGSAIRAPCLADRQQRLRRPQEPSPETGQKTLKRTARAWPWSRLKPKEKLRAIHGYGGFVLRLAAGNPKRILTLG